MTSGSKADGIITMTYEYNLFQKPVLQLDQAQHDAVKRCQAWGYSNAEFFDIGTKTCINYNYEYNFCSSFRVTHTAQCTVK